MALSATARSILSSAAAHPLGIALPPAALPAAARDAVRRSLLKQGLVAECAAPAEQIGVGWRLPDGIWTAMQITEAGRQAVAAEAPAETMPPNGQERVTGGGGGRCPRGGAAGPPPEAPAGAPRARPQPPG